MENEKRLIDANALRSEMYEYVFPITANNLMGAADSYYRILHLLENAPTVDAVEVADMREFAEDVAYQFGYYSQKGGRLHITHGGLSTLEWAFDILGWENPHPVPEYECEVDGCHEHATCGTPTKDGYKIVCGKHFSELQKEA